MNNQTKLASFHRVILFAWVFVLVLALFPLTANPVKPIKELASALFVSLLAITLLAVPIKPGTSYDWPRMPALLLGALWLAWGLICALVSEFKMAGLDELRVYLTWLLVALFSARVFREPRHVRQLFLVVCAAVFLSSVYGFAQYLGWDIFPWSTRDVEEYRGLPSTYANPNFAGHVLMLTLIIGAFLLTVKRFWWVGVPLLLIAAHLYQTHMRGAPLALVAGVAVAGCAFLVSRLCKSRSTLKPVWVLSLAAVLGVVGVLALLPVAKMRTGYYFPTDGSLILRYNGYYGAAKMVLDHPVTGVGPGNYGREAIAYWTPYEKRWFADQQKRNMHTHCDLLETAAESGLPGLALHVALLMALLVRSLSLAFTGDTIEKRRLGYTFTAFFTAFIVDGLFGFNLRVPVSGGLFFLMAGVLEGILSPLPAPVVPVEGGKKKKKKQRTATATPERQPRVLSSLALCGAALMCLVFAGVVFAGEIQYQRGNAVKVFLETPDTAQYHAQALKQGEEALLTARSLVFWDERYSDLLGHLAMRGGDTGAAIDYYGRALQTDPHHPHKAANRARAYLSEALKFARDNTVPEYTQVERLLEDAQRMAALGERYCAVSPYVQDVLWRIARARAILAEEQAQNAAPHWEEAAQRIETSRETGPRDVTGTNKGLGMAYMKLDRPEKALEPLVHVLEADSTDESAWALLENASRDSGNTAAIFSVLHKSYAQTVAGLPDTEEAFVGTVRRMANFFEDLDKNRPMAARVVRHGLAEAPQRPELWALLSGVAAARAKPDMVCREAEKYADEVPKFVGMICSHAEGANALGLASQEIAREAMQAAGQPAARDFAGAADLIMLLLDGRALPGVGDAEIKANIATVYLEAGRFAEADQYFAAAIARLPDNTRGRLMSARARALTGMHRDAEALTLIEQAVRHAPGDPLVQLTYARLLATAGRTDEAEFAFRAALDSLPDASPLKVQAQRELALLRARKTQAGL